MTDAGLQLYPPELLGDYLGCGQFPVDVSPAEASRRLEHTRSVIAPSLGPNSPKPGGHVRAARYDMFGFFEQCVLRYCELANIPRSSLKKAKTRSSDDSQLTSTDLEEEGQFSSDVAKVLMKVLYGARLVR